MVIEELASRIQQLENRLMNICRIGQVAVVDPMTAKVDVNFEEGLTVQGIPFLTMRAGEDQTYWLPSVGELGVMFCPSGDIANALFLPAIFYTGFPADAAMSEMVAKRVYRDGIEEEVDTDAHSWKLTSGDSERFVDQSKVEDKHTDQNVIKIDATETKVERVAGKVRSEVGTSYHELTAVLANIIGAHLFPTGITTLQSPVGPVLFAPAASPPSAPSPPAGSMPDGDGNVTQTPASSISGVSVQATSTLSLTLPAIPVTAGGTAGATTPGTYSATVTGTINLQFPARSL